MRFLDTPTNASKTGEQGERSSDNDTWRKLKTDYFLRLALCRVFLDWKIYLGLFQKTRFSIYCIEVFSPYLASLFKTTKTGLLSGKICFLEIGLIMY
jgi:hypothetical protein